MTITEVQLKTGLTMRIDHETRQHVLLTTLGVLMIAVAVSMLSNLWAHERPTRAIPCAFEEVFVAASLDASTMPACLTKRCLRCGSGACVRVSALAAAESDLSENLPGERPSAVAKKPCRHLCRR